uniref:Uncharacterized protein n=1 Tax=Oryza nivara TaxID=4536 RepID=A0A0E0GB43_ORYNI
MSGDHDRERAYQLVIPIPWEILVLYLLRQLKIFCVHTNRLHTSTKDRILLLANKPALVFLCFCISSVK